MYLLCINFENAKKNGSGKYYFKENHGEICKWTILPSGPAQREMLQLMAIACSGVGFISRLPFELSNFCRITGAPLHLEFVIARHAPRDAKISTPPVFGSGVEINHKGRAQVINKHHCRLLPSDLPIRKLLVGNGNSKYILLGYGSGLNHHQNTDHFDFSDTYHRITRYHSLFSPSGRITDPIAFLRLLHYRGIKVSRFPAKQALIRLNALLKEHLDIDAGRWLEKSCNFKREWSQLRPWEQRALLPVLDAVRHMIDASPSCGTPLEQPGLMLLDRADFLCTEKIFPRWIRLMDSLFPAMQFVLTLSDKARKRFPRLIQRKKLPLPDSSPKPKAKRKQTRLRPGTVLLIDVDGRLPNLALMKLSRYFKEQGRRVLMAHKVSRFRSAGTIYASCVFSSPASLRRVAELRKFYGESLIVGGSGVDIHGRLPLEIESIPADYSLYPVLNDCAIGFITRGCPYKCPFCIVPIKEGKTHQVADLEELLQKRYKKLILLDDNILSHPRAAEFLEEMVRRNLQVNFTQTLDIRLLNKETMGIVRRIRCSNIKFTRTNYHFSLNDTHHIDRVRKKYEQIGFTPGDNVEFVCMYGYNTTLAEDIERFRFLRSLPGAYVFVQLYQPIPGGATPILANFFSENTDELIDELIKIVFPQNMKSMEKYYGWVSKRYAMSFGKLHMGLVDTIFKYNNRHHKGRYIATLAGTRKSNLLH
jgi:hypothetical protein